MIHFRLDKSLSKITTDEVRAYLATYPSVVDEDEITKQLLLAIDTNDKEKEEQLRNKLVENNLLFVVSIAKQMFNNIDVPILDVIQYGNIGMITASKKFDPTKGFKFISYAVNWILESIYLNIQKESFIYIPSNIVVQNNKLKKELEKRIQDSQSLIEDPDIIERQCISIHTTVSEDRSYEDILSSSDEECSNTVDIVKDIIFHTKFSVQTLSNERMQNIMWDFIELRMKGHSRSAVRTELSMKYNMGVERIRQIVKKCIHILKENKINECF